MSSEPSADGTTEAFVLGTIRDYQLLHPIGAGGMGQVYKALHTRLKKEVAVKVLPAEQMSRKQAVARFQREMEAVGKLEHPNIVRATDAGEHDGTHFLVMELVDGVDLAHLVKDHGPLPVADACELVRQAAIGLQHAHDHGLVHRDIKPSNLMLTRDGQVKILDLGLALLDEQTDGAMTASGQVMGTLDYMAPEQSGDSHEVDQRADLYALGATLYKLLGGRAPFDDPQYDTTIKKLIAVATADPPSLSEIRPGISPELAELVGRLLSKKPDQRLPTAQALADSLELFSSTSHLDHLAARGKKGESLDEPHDGETAEHWRSSFSSTSPTLKQVADSGRKHSSRVPPMVVASATLVVALLVLAAIWSVIFFSADPSGGDVANGDSSTKGEMIGQLASLGEPPTPVILLTPDKVVVDEGDSISGRALVSNPSKLPGVRSWTIETQRQRGPVNALEFSPDDQWLAAGSSDGVLRIREAMTGKLVCALAGHGGEILGLSWSPSGRYVVTGGRHPAWIVWDVFEQREVARYSERGATEYIDWSPDGTKIAFQGTYGLYVIDVAGNFGRIWKSQHIGQRRIAFSPDSKRIAAIKHGAVRVWDSQTGEELHSLQPALMSTGERFGIAWSSDGQLVAGCDSNETIRVWNAKSGELAHELSIGADAESKPNDLAFLPGDGQLISVGDNHLRVWDLESGESRLFGTSLTASPLSLSSSKEHLLTVSNWRSVIAVNKLPEKELLWRVGGYGGKCVWAPELVHRGQTTRFVAVEDRRTHLFDLRQRLEDSHATIRRGYSGYHSPVNVTPTLDLLTHVNGGSPLTIWDFENPQQPLRTELNIRGNMWKFISSDGNWLAIRNKDNKEDGLRLLLLRGEQISELDNTEMPLRWSPHGDIYAVKKSNELILRHASDGAEVATLVAEEELDGLFAWSPDGRMIASLHASQEKTSVWSIDQRLPKLVVKHPRLLPNRSIYLSENHLALVNLSKPTRVWELKNGSLVAEDTNIAKQEVTPWNFDFHLDSAHGRLTYVTQESKLFEFNFDTNRVSSLSQGHLQHADNARLNPAQDLALSAATDGSVHLWRMSSGEQLCAIALLNEDVLFVAPDGHYHAPPEVEEELIYIVMTDDGKQLTMRPAEFKSAYGWVNDPA